MLFKGIGGGETGDIGSGDFEAGLLLRISVHMHTPECSNSEGAMVMKLFRTELPAGVYGH